MGRKIYYYTDYNTFKLILQNGTLRFKQSTSSNDSLDTVHIYDILKLIAKENLDRGTKTEPLKFIYELYDHTKYASNKICAVACFTLKRDSRLLWDAYTMNRKDRKAERYNGVCIEIDEDELRKVIHSYRERFDYADIKPIMYGDSKIYIFLNDVLKMFLAEHYEMKKDTDQNQDIVPPIYLELAGNITKMKLKKCIVLPALTLTNYIENAAPLFKHDFWSEEEEVRAVVAIKNARLTDSPMERWNEDFYYFDMPINSDCISKIILGPEMTDEEVSDLQDLKGKLSFSSFESERSSGTGIITSAG